MNFDIVTKVIGQYQEGGRDIVWDAPTRHHIRLWWQGGYADVMEREDEFLERYNVAELFAPTTVPSRFHKVCRYDKGPKKYTDERITRSVAFVLKRLVELRSRTSFVSDPQFGLQSLAPELARMCHWEGWAELDVFRRRETHLSLIGTPDGATDAQRQWYSAILQRQDSLLPAIEQAIFSSYAKMLERIDLDFEVSGPSAVHAHINPEGLHLTSADDDPEDPRSLVGELRWRTAWDQEHGVTVRLNQHFEVYDVE
jgi:hypothetical protein